jgi:hypothetical protein
MAEEVAEGSPGGSMANVAQRKPAAQVKAEVR